MAKSKRPILIIISGPSGVGKDAILAAMKEMKLPYHFTVTATSRTQRPGEIDGVDYRFISKEKFDQMIENGEFLEWANVYENFYGVPREPVVQAISEGKDVIVKVDIQGAAAVKKIEPDAVSIFIAPPSMEELERRLTERKTESKTDLELRLKIARTEMDNQDRFDHVVLSERDGIPAVISKIESIIKTEKQRVESKSSSQKSISESKIKTLSRGGIKRLSSTRAGDEVLRIPRKPRYRRILSRFLLRTRTILRL